MNVTLKLEMEYSNLLIKIFLKLKLIGVVIPIFLKFEDRLKSFVDMCIVIWCCKEKL